MSNLIGKTLGNYQIVERIGRGGMAEVYKGYHPRLDRHVAIKILHGFLAEGQDFLERFEREAKAVASLRHPNIVQIHDYETKEDQYYMVMEYVDGATLTDVLIQYSKSKDTMPLQEVYSIIKQVSDALDYAHKHGLIHRDIKPSNILIDNVGNTFLTDFGIAKIVSSTQFTATGALIGTPAYMSPEQCKGTDLTHVSDLYSLGIILYEMLTGLVPYDSETPLSVLQKHITEPVPSLETLRADLPATFEKVIKKALAKEPEDRYQRANEMCKALERALSEVEGTGEKAKADIEEPTPADTTTKPTVVMEGDDITDATFQPTVVMEETKEEEAVPPVEEKIEVEAVKEPPPERKKEQPSPKRKVKAKKPKPVQEKTTQSGFDLKSFLSNKFVLIGGALVIVVVLVFVVVSDGISDPTFTPTEVIEEPKEEEAVPPVEEEIGDGGGGCFSLEDCLLKAHEAMDSHEWEDATGLFEDAASYVPEDEHSEFADIWCQRGELLMELGRVDQANESYEICGEWEQGR